MTKVRLRLIQRTMRTRCLLASEKSAGGGRVARPTRPKTRLRSKSLIPPIICSTACRCIATNAQETPLAASRKPKAKREKSDVGGTVEIASVLDVICFYRPRQNSSSGFRHSVTELADEVHAALTITLEVFTEATKFASLTSEVQKEIKCARARASKRSDNRPAGFKTAKTAWRGSFSALWWERTRNRRSYQCLK